MAHGVSQSRSAEAAGAAARAAAWAAEEAAAWAARAADTNLDLIALAEESMNY